MHEFKYKTAKGQKMISNEAYDMVLSEYVNRMKDSSPDNIIRNVLCLQNYQSPHLKAHTEQLETVSKDAFGKMKVNDAAQIIMENF